MVVDYPSKVEKLIIFGDGCLATLFDCFPNEATDEIMFIFKPTQYMRWRHQIPEEDFDEQHGVIKKSFPKNLCQLLDPSAQFQKWLLYVDYNGKPCDLTNQLDQTLLVKVTSLRNERDAWKKSAILVPKRMKRMITHPEEATDELLARLAKQKKVMGSSIIEDSSGEKDE